MIVLPGTPPPTSVAISLDSSRGKPIENGQVTEISAFESSQVELIRQRWGAGVQLRTRSTPRYNCHGMTFASRRTGIFARDVIDQILVEDGYAEIESKDILPGDVIVYYSSDGDAEHSGVVLTTAVGDQLGVPKVVSKWGKGPEYIHWANTGPYSFANVKYYRISAANANDNTAPIRSD